MLVISIFLNFNSATTFYQENIIKLINFQYLISYFDLRFDRMFEKQKVNYER